MLMYMKLLNFLRKVFGKTEEVELQNEVVEEVVETPAVKEEVVEPAIKVCPKCGKEECTCTPEECTCTPEKTDTPKKKHRGRPKKKQNKVTE